MRAVVRNATTQVTRAEPLFTKSFTILPNSQPLSQRAEARNRLNRWLNSTAQGFSVITFPNSYRQA